MPKPQLKLNKLKATYLILALSALFAVGSYGWRVYTLFRDWQMNMPQPQIERLTRDLRIYHARTGRFPSTFMEINDLIWHTKPAPDYGHEGRQAHTKNCYYFYTKVNDDTCAIWTLPIGPQRHYASSFFIVLSLAWLRSWRGNALEDEAIGKLPAVPSPNKLAEMGMREMPGQVLAGR